MEVTYGKDHLVAITVVDNVKRSTQSVCLYGRFTFERIHNTKDQIDFYERVENHKAKERMFKSFNGRIFQVNTQMQGKIKDSSKGVHIYKGAECCCSEKKCEPTVFRGRTYYKCVTVNCGYLPDPVNGNVSTPGGTTFESLAEYRCNEGYKLSYPADRTCLSSGLWSGMAPRCKPEPFCGKLECPTLETLCNVLVDSPINPKPGDVATYDCLEGFELDGEETRTCQDDYMWDGIAPCCVKRPCKEMAKYVGNFEGSSYWFSDYQVISSQSWVNAAILCEADGAHLVEITSEAEQMYLDTFLSDGPHLSWWTNGNDNNGVWVWPVHGSDFTPGSSDVYTNWFLGDPIQSPSCMAISDEPLNHQWLAHDCSSSKEFICEC